MSRRTKTGFLEYLWVFHFLAPTVPFILGWLGIPIFGNKAIPSWLWHGPNDHFYLFPSQAEHNVPPHGQHLAGTEPDPLIEERTWLCCSLSCCLFRYFCPLFLLPLPDCIRRFFILFHLSASNFLFITSSLLYSLFPTCTPFISSTVFQMIPRYSSYSPEDALIPRFPAQSADRFQRVLRVLWQNRFTNSC